MQAKDRISDGARRQAQAERVAAALNKHCGVKDATQHEACAYARYGRVLLFLPPSARPEQIGVLLELAKKIGL